MISGTTTNRASYLRQAVGYVGKHPELLEHYITDTFDVSDVQSAVELAVAPSAGRLKITLRMG